METWRSPLDVAEGEATAAQPEKRFAPSREAFSQERLKALKSTIDTMKRENPEVLSFTMFGSMARGNPHQESDIDGYLFVEVSEKDDLESPEPKVEEVLKEDPYVTERETLFTREAAQPYRKKFEEHMMKNSDMTAEQIQQGLKIRPMNERILKQEVDDIVAGLEAKAAYDEAYDSWFDARPVDSTDLKALIAYRLAEPERPPTTLPSSAISGMFHMDVGGGIRKYREQLLDDLASRGEVGEKVWERIIEDTDMMENYGTSNKRYPRTLAEAQALYGSRAE